MNRVPETVAMAAWYSSPERVISQSSLAQPTSASSAPQLSNGLSAILEARNYAYVHDPRIDKQAGKTWFWADTRIEALDLHEVNNKFVGVKDDIRGRKQMDDWRKVLGALDGKSGGMEAYQAVRKKREQDARKEQEQSGYGMVAATATAGAAMTSGGEGVGSSEEDAGEAG